MSMDYIPAAAVPVARLIHELNKLPGIGPKSAQRLAYYLIRLPSEEVHALANALIVVKERIVLCSICQNLTDTNPCPICVGHGRDHTQICVVEDPLDVLALQRDGKMREAILQLMKVLVCDE